METFSTLLAFCSGNHRSTVNSQYKGQWRGALMFSLICAWTNSWTNNGDASDLRCHHAHYVNVMHLIWACYTETDHFPATRIIELFSHRVLLLCKSNCIAAQNPVEHTVCVGLGVVMVNTGNAEVTRLLNEAHAENPHHRSLWSQSTPCLICMVRHTNNTFSWPQKILRYSWPVMFNCRIICCHNIFGQPAVIIRSTPDTTDFFNVPWLYYACQNGMGGYIFGIDCILMASLQSWCKSA